jgi:hypothetical protein
MSIEVTKRRFTVDDYHRMGEAGILSEDDRVTASGHVRYFQIDLFCAEFVSRLFSKKRPSGLTAKSTVDTAYLAAESSKDLYEEYLKAVEDLLMKKHGFPLTTGDLEGIRWALGNYYRFGPSGSSIAPAMRHLDTSGPSMVGAQAVHGSA